MLILLLPLGHQPKLVQPEKASKAMADKLGHKSQKCFIYLLEHHSSMISHYILFMIYLFHLPFHYYLFIYVIPFLHIYVLVRNRKKYFLWVAIFPPSISVCLGYVYLRPVSTHAHGSFIPWFTFWSWKDSAVKCPPSKTKQNKIKPKVVERNCNLCNSQEPSVFLSCLVLFLKWALWNALYVRCYVIYRRKMEAT